jgi:hypothetical protein
LEAAMLAALGARMVLTKELVASLQNEVRILLYLYLRACGREELSTANLWAGVDAVTTA